MTPYQISLYSGEKILLSLEEYRQVAKAWLAGAEQFLLGSNMIQRKAIAHIGQHQGTAGQLRMEVAEIERLLSDEEKKIVNEKKFLTAQKQFEKTKRERLGFKTRLINLGNGETMSLLEESIGSPQVSEIGMTEDEEVSGVPMYYLDGQGEKHYS